MPNEGMRSRPRPKQGEQKPTDSTHREHHDDFGRA